MMLWRLKAWSRRRSPRRFNFRQPQPQTQQNYQQQPLPSGMRGGTGGGMGGGSGEKRVRSGISSSGFWHDRTLMRWAGGSRLFTGGKSMTSSGEENGYFKEEVTVRSRDPGDQIPYLEFGIVSIPALGEPDDLTDSDDTDDEPWHEDPRTCACLLTPGGGCPEISVITRGHTERIDLAPWFEEDPRNLERWDFLDGERIGFSLALTGEGCGRLQFLRDDTPYGPEVEVPNAR